MNVCGYDVSLHFTMISHTVWLYFVDESEVGSYGVKYVNF